MERRALGGEGRDKTMGRIQRRGGGQGRENGTTIYTGCII